ncbi:MAG: cytochrome c oxidase, subunit [Steroidobacteraceae bacterium]|jgi:cytochrome c oxidase subunit 2|nr:cytochrome c oxidase, subunit [Steroidobacteraceae bacterium]
MEPTWRPAAGSSASLIHELSLTMYVGCTVIFLLVMALLLYAVFSRPRPVRARLWLAVGGLAFPVTVLVALLGYSVAVGNTLNNFQGQGVLRFLLDCVSDASRALGLSTTDAAAIRVEVKARQWWWEVRYRIGAEEFELANELRLPAGRAVELELVTEDVIHSFWVPSLAGKVDMIPGHRNRLVLKADEPGVHGGVCAEYCGGQHALMGLVVVVETEDGFQRWRERQARDAAAPGDDFLAQGRSAFMRGGCGDCHAVRGTEARGDLGPDLTHVGSRHSLAAGVLTNHVGTMAGWIAGGQALKPGNAMPDARDYDGQELRAVAAWLESLR